MSSPPTSLGQYQIIREIARSNDIVYEAWDALMNRRVAIKELNVPSGSTPQQTEDRVSRFRREAQAVGTLNHPNIMTVFSFGTDQDRHFMAMEYLDGTALRHEIDSKGFLAPERAVEIAIDVLRGLEHAHNSGVIHRDIKPDNVQITSSGQVKITDFGIARLTFQPNLTMDGQVFGTPSYMSPEQVIGKEIDARSDLFSVGVMLYEMLAGTKPFTGDNVVAIATSIANHHPQRPPQIEQGLWRVIEKSIDKTPSMRHANAAAMRAELEATVQQGPSVYSQPAYQQDPYSSQNQYAQPDPYQTPYGQVAPPVPFGSQASYIQTPYGQQPAVNQYGVSPGANSAGQAPPVIVNQTPYGTPSYSQPYGYSPSSYGQYNPYNGPLPGQGPLMPPNPGQYYPPPPRQPLIKPETKELLSRVGLMVLILLTVILAIIFGFMGLLNGSKTPSASRGPSISPSDSAGSGLPKESATSPPISGEGGGTGNPVAGGTVPPSKSVPGQDSSSEDKALLAKSQANAEADAESATAAYNRAKSYGDLAGKQDLLAQAGKDWAHAARTHPDNKRAQTYLENAARAYLEAARVAQSLNRPKSTIRDLLYHAQENAVQGTALWSEIDGVMSELRIR